MLLASALKLVDSRNLVPFDPKNVKSVTSVMLARSLSSTKASAVKALIPPEP